MLAVFKIHTVGNGSASVHIYDIFASDDTDMSADGSSGGTGSADDELDLVNLFAHELQRIEKRRRYDNCGSVLVVMKYGNCANFFKPAFYFKASRRGYILKIDSAEGIGDVFYRVYKFVRVLGRYAEGNSVNIGKLAEEEALAFHNRH